MTDEEHFNMLMCMPTEIMVQNQVLQRVKKMIQPSERTNIKPTAENFKDINQDRLND